MTDRGISILAGVQSAVREIVADWRVDNPNADPRKFLVCVVSTDIFAYARQYICHTTGRERTDANEINFEKLPIAVDDELPAATCNVHDLGIIQFNASER